MQDHWINVGIHNIIFKAKVDLIIFRGWHKLVNNLFNIKAKEYNEYCTPSWTHLNLPIGSRNECYANHMIY